MRKILFVFIIFLYGSSAWAGRIEDLSALNFKAKNKSISVDVIDKLLIDLHDYEGKPGANQEIDSLLLDTYRSIADGYAANFHFKQAYPVYRKYLDYKSSTLFQERKNRIARAIASEIELAEVKQKNHKELSESEEELEGEINWLETKFFAWKGNISLLLIICSAVFALLLVSSGIKLFSRRSKGKQNREQILKIHRKAVTAAYGKGINESFNSSMVSINGKLKEMETIMQNNIAEFPDSARFRQEFSILEKNLKSG